MNTDNLRRQYARNAEGLRKMLARAEMTGKRVGGYTAAELRVSVATYEQLADTGIVPTVNV